jgi:hypothetical protein
MGFRLKRRPHRLTLFVAVAVASCFASSALAQGTGDIIGRVVDAETGSPLPFASVGIANSVLGANSQQDGGFLIRGLAPGRYTLRASYIGYEEQELTVTVEAFRATEANFRLSPKSAAGKVDTVLVTGERPLVDVAEVSTVRRTTADEIAKLPVDDLFDVVERQIGVTGDNEELHIRGGRTDETLFQIDDVAMKNVITGGAVGGSFSAKAMQNVEVITGGYQAEYGQAISGIVRAELKEAGDVTRTSVEYQTGSFDTQRFFLQTEGPLLPQDGNYPIPGQLSFLLGIDALATDTYLPSLRDATDYDNPLLELRRFPAAAPGQQHEHLCQAHLASDPPPQAEPHLHQVREPRSLLHLLSSRRRGPGRGVRSWRVQLLLPRSDGPVPDDHGGDQHAGVQLAVGVEQPRLLELHLLALLQQPGGSGAGEEAVGTGGGVRCLGADRPRHLLRRRPERRLPTLHQLLRRSLQLQVQPHTSLAGAP